MLATHHLCSCLIRPPKTKVLSFLAAALHWLIQEKTVAQLRWYQSGMLNGVTALANDRLPDVIGLGAEKCGSTSLHYYLRAHPEVGVQRVKEMRFFLDDGSFHKGVDWYKRQFPAGAKTLMESHGGGYTDYPRTKAIPERIHGLIPGARFIYLVRNPIDRMISRWVHNYSNSDEHRPVEEALLDLDDPEYAPQSMYYMQLQQYLAYFDVSRFLVVNHLDLLNKRVETLQRIFRFMGVDPGFYSSEFNLIRHSSQAKRRHTRLGMWLHENAGRCVFERLHGPQRHWFKKLFYTAVSRPVERSELSRPVKERLREVFAPDVAALERLVGANFEGWLQ